MALVTAAEVRSYVPQIVGTGEDTRLGVLIGGAESALARALFFPRADDGTYALEDKTYTFKLEGPDPNSPRDLVLPMRPIVSITSVYQDADEAYTTLVASTDYLGSDAELLAAGHVRLVYSPACGAWLTGAKGYRPVRVVCVAGWATAPAHVIQAVAYQVQYELGQGRTAGAHSVSMGGKSSTAGYGGGGSSAGAGVDPRAMALLAQDRLWERACG